MGNLIESLAAPSPLLLWLWGLLAVLLVLLYQRRTSSLVIAQGPLGRLEISRHALHRLLETCCEQLKGVAQARAKVCRRNGKFLTELRLRVRPDAKLEAIQGYLNQEIAEIYRENLGLDAIGPIRIRVVGVAPARTEY